MPPQREERSYYCRRCGAEEKGRHVPKNWYSLGRYAPDLNADGRRRLVGMGLFDKLECLVAQVEELNENGGAR